MSATRTATPSATSAHTLDEFAERVEHAIVALAERCTHRRGPLHAGEIAEQGRVQLRRGDDD